MIKVKKFAQSNEEDLISLKTENIYNFSIMIAFFMFLLAGGMFNLTALITNGGKMPVQMERDLDTSRHFSFQDKEEINNYLLTDIFYFFKFIVSIGDLVMIISGVFVLIFSVKSAKISFKIMKLERRNKYESKKKKGFL